MLIVTDNEIPDYLPDNVRLVRTSLGKLRESFSRTLGFDAALSTPYKLCDYKPAFGMLFQEHLDGYDFWGHGDIDLVYGDLSPILDPGFLENFDIVSGREEWIWGPFCLYRNTPDISALFRTSCDYEMAYRTERHLAFDESSRRWAEMRKSSVFDIDFPYENMTLVAKRAARDGRIRAHFKTLEVDHISDGSHVFYNGRVFYNGKESLFLHWGTYLYRGRMTMPTWSRWPDRFYVTPLHCYTQKQFESMFFPVAENIRQLAYRCRRFVRLL